MSGHERAATMWKVVSRHDTTYFEVDEYGQMIARLTQEAILAEYRAPGAGHDWQRRNRLRSWLMRSTDDEGEVPGMRQRQVPEPKVHALVGGEWVEADWTLIEPTVDVSVPPQSGSSPTGDAA